MSERIKRMLWTIIAALLIGYLALIVLVLIGQKGMLYYPMRDIDATPQDRGLSFEEVTLRTGDGLDISAWYVPAPDERAVLLFCHGNAGNISHRLDSILIFHNLGLSVMIFDYRGYGKSQGSPSEKGTYRDAEAAWDYIVNQKNIDPERVILFGRSLGGAIAAELAVRHKAGALIIESGFTSVPDVGKRMFPYLPVRLLARYNYNTAEKAGNAPVPKLIIHSPEDEIMPFEHGTSLFERAAEPKEFLEIGGGHNEGFLVSGKTYIKGLDSFIAKNF